MRQWYIFWNSTSAIAQQAVAQLENSKKAIGQIKIAKQLATQLHIDILKCLNYFNFGIQVSRMIKTGLV